MSATGRYRDSIGEKKQTNHQDQAGGMYQEDVDGRSNMADEETAVEERVNQQGKWSRAALRGI